MAKPTPVEEWTLSKDNYVNQQKSVMVEIRKHTIYFYFDAHEYTADNYVWGDLTPEQARALATMLLYAAEQVDPSGD